MAINSSISIIIPTRNRVVFLKNCLGLLLKSIKKDDQIIICDNSSSEQTRRYCQLLQTDYPNIDYVQIHKTGPSSARNVGVTLANRPYLVFLDDDCLVDQRWRKTMSDIMDKEKKAHHYALHQGVIRYVFQRQSRLTQLFYLRQQVTSNILRLDSSAPRPIGIRYLNAGSFFLHHSLLKVIGQIFDEQTFPFVGEERDLAIRAELKHIPIFLEPALVVIHHKKNVSLRAGIARSFLQGVASAKIIRRYVVDQSVAQLFGLRQRDEFLMVFDRTISAIPKHFSEPLSVLIAQCTMMIYKGAYLLGKKLYA